jgi:hypothetical protein
MQKLKFYNAIENYNQINNKDVDLLKNAIEKYPYFKAAYILLLKQKSMANAADFDEFLKLAAVYANNRAALYDLIFEENPEKKEEKVKEKTASEKEVAKPAEKPQKSAEELRKEIDDRVKEIQKSQAAEQTSEKVDEKKQEIEGKKEELKTEEISEKEEVRAEEAQIEEKKQRDREEIIESFIKRNPKINKPQDDDYSETEEQAKKSLNDNLNFVSETLAQIYASQGNKNKAKEIYEQLMLKFPEKKLYFADQIKNLGLIK